jgi:hypothetical protein
MVRSQCDAINRIPSDAGESKHGNASIKTISALKLDVNILFWGKTAFPRFGNVPLRPSLQARSASFEVAHFVLDVPSPPIHLRVLTVAGRLQWGANELGERAG